MPKIIKNFQILAKILKMLKMRKIAKKCQDNVERHTENIN